MALYSCAGYCSFFAQCSDRESPTEFLPHMLSCRERECIFAVGNKRAARQSGLANWADVQCCHRSHRTRVELLEHLRAVGIP